MLFAVIAKGEVLQSDAVHGIMGEAAGEPYQAKLWIACVIRNNGNLNGVYGAKRPDDWYRAQPTYAQAACARAWSESATNHVTTCKHFGGMIDDKYFIDKLHLKPVKTIGHTRFYNWF